MATCICSDRATHPSGCYSTAVDGKTLCTWCIDAHWRPGKSEPVLTFSFTGTASEFADWCARYAKGQS